MAFDPDQPLERAGFKFLKRCDIRDTSSFLRKMEYMEGNSGEHPRTGSNLRRTWIPRARRFAGNGSGNRRGTEAVQD
eukprot:9443195-Heterocapsa_arctica.AAC.1